MSDQHSDFTVSIPDELVDRIAKRAAKIVLAAQADAITDPWLSVAQAAEHLSCPRSRVYALVSKRAIPHEKDGSRTLFRRSELDRFVRDGGARR